MPQPVPWGVYLGILGSQTRLHAAQGQKLTGQVMLNTFFRAQTLGYLTPEPWALEGTCRQGKGWSEFPETEWHTGSAPLRSAAWSLFHTCMGISKDVVFWSLDLVSTPKQLSGHWKQSFWRTPSQVDIFSVFCALVFSSETEVFQNDDSMTLIYTYQLHTFSMLQK